MWDDDRFTRFYHETYHQVFCYLVSCRSSPADIVDLVQDTFLRFYKRVCRKDAQIENPKRCLLRIAVHFDDEGNQIMRLLS